MTRALAAALSIALAAALAVVLVGGVAAAQGLGSAGSGAAGASGPAGSTPTLRGSGAGPSPATGTYSGSNAGTNGSGAGPSPATGTYSGSNAGTNGSAGGGPTPGGSAGGGPTPGGPAGGGPTPGGSAGGAATGSGAARSGGSAAGTGASPATGAYGGSNAGTNGSSGSGSTMGGSAGGGSTMGGSASGAASGSGAGSGGGSAVVIQLPPEFGEPEVSAAASPTDLKLGDRFTLFITATYGAGIEVNLPATVELGDAFEVRRTSSEDHVRPDGKHVREWQMDVVAWDLGDLRVPPVPVTFTLGGQAGQILTNAVPVRVTGVLGEADDPKLMRADAPPVMLKSRDWLWVWIGGGVVVVVVAAVTFVVLRRRRRRRVRALVGGLAPAVSRRIDMTSERALERLLAIEQSGVLEQDDGRKGGYVEMAVVIRDYLGARYGFATAELTTSELLRGLGKRAPAHEQALAEHWLAKCDLVRYGGVRATAGQAGQLLADARELVMQTTAQPAKQEAA